MTTRSEAPKDPRPYFRMTNDIADNPKIVDLDEDIPFVGWALTVALSACNHSHTDGIFSVGHVIRKACVPPRIADVMVKQMLWHLPGHDCKKCEQPPEGKAIVHDYLEHQRSAEEMMSLTEKRRAAGRAGGNKRAENLKKQQVDPDPDPDPVAKAVASATAPATANGINAVMASAKANAVASATANAEQTRSKAVAEERRFKELEVQELKTQELKTPPTPIDQLGGAGPDVDAAKPGGGEDDLELQKEIRALYVLVEKIVAVRPRWSPVKVAQALESELVASQPWPVVEAAMLLAAESPSVLAPGRLAYDGPWWTEAERRTRPTVPVSDRGPRCELHPAYAPDRCVPCATLVRDAEVEAEWRQSPPGVTLSEVARRYKALNQRILSDQRHLHAVADVA